MPALPVEVFLEVLLGIYLGLLTGIVPAFAAGSLGFLVRYVTGVSLPGFGVVVLALAIASINGGLLAIAQPEILNSPRLLVAVLVVIMLALYTHSQGDKLGGELPRRVSLTSFRKRTLSADVVEFVGTVGQVTVRPAGEIRDVEGYPPLTPDLRSTLRDGSWRLPADLPLSELEVRLEERLRTDHDLADVSVTIDERGWATIAAAPPSSALSKRVPEGRRAVSIDALVPTGLAHGDEVRIRTPEGTVTGTVLSVRASGDESTADGTIAVREAGADDETDDDSVSPPVEAYPGTAGGEGRLTVAVSRRDARTVLGTTTGQVVVQSGGTSHEFEALSVLRRADDAVRRVTVGEEVEPSTDDVGVTILAVRRSGGGGEHESERADGRGQGRGHDQSRTQTQGHPRTVGQRIDSRLALAWLDRIRRRPRADDETPRRDWVVAPGIERRLEVGDEVFVAGSDDALDRFVEAAR